MVDSHQQGFAVIIALGLMAFMVLLLLSLTALVRVETENAKHGMDQLLARQNALLAVSIGIGELQKNAGPDRRVSARADVVAENIPNPHWTGIWRSDDPALATQPFWLVSRATDAAAASTVIPSTTFDASNSALLHKPAADVIAAADPTDPAAKQTRAPLVDLPQSGPGGGSFAWWVADEGAKARVDLAPSEVDEATLSAQEHRAMAGAAQATAIHRISNDFESELFDREGTVQRSRLITPGSLAVTAADAALPAKYFHGITSGGYGLPVNAKAGGFKTDLSLVFDRSQTGNPVFNASIGASPGAAVMNGTGFYTFGSILDKDTFYLSEKIASNVAGGVGPNWGILFNYARL